jgi:hypothetical protein
MKKMFPQSSGVLTRLTISQTTTRPTRPSPIADRRGGRRA